MKARTTNYLKAVQMYDLVTYLKSLDTEHMTISQAVSQSQDALGFKVTTSNIYGISEQFGLKFKRQQSVTSTRADEIKELRNAIGDLARELNIIMVGYGLDADRISKYTKWGE